MAIPTPRRFYLLKRRAATELGEFDLASAWRAKQEAIAWPDLPSDFPSRAALVAAGYTTVRDCEGADETELLGLGLSKTESAAVIAATEQWQMIATKLKNYQRQDGRFATVYDAPLFPSAARTATTTSDTYEMGELDTLRMKLDVTAASGTNPTLDVVIQTSPDGATNWQSLGTFAQKTAVSSELNVFPGSDRFVRAVATLGGTNPSFTFSLLGEAV